MIERLRIAFEIYATYCQARIWLRGGNFEEAVRRARGIPVLPDAHLDAEPDFTRACIRLGDIVVRALRLAPIDARCLMSALVLTRMLTRRGIQASFVLGVRLHPDFAAHAWLERGSVPILPTTSDFHTLTAL